MSHQIGNRRLTATRFRKPSSERVTQVVPMQVFNLRKVTSRPERVLDVGVRLGRIGIDEDVSTAASSASDLLQRASHVFVHRHRIVSSRF